MKRIQAYEVSNGWVICWRLFQQDYAVRFPKHDLALIAAIWLCEVATVACFVGAVVCVLVAIAKGGQS